MLRPEDLLPEERAEAAEGAFALLRPDLDLERIDRQAYTDLAGGSLTGDRAVSYWTEKWRFYLLKQRLEQEMSHPNE